MKLLVIEDDPMISEFLSTGLGYEGYQVKSLASGREALACLRQEDFDLVILDIMLPDMDGYQVCRRIRSRGYDLPIIMLTVKKEISDRVRGLDSGADDYLTKPFSFEELLARIRALLRRGGRPGEVRKLKSQSLVLDLEPVKSLKTGNRSISRRPSSACWKFSCAIPVRLSPGTRS